MEEPNSYKTGPDEQGRFGDYGGRFVAETLMPLILELEEAYRSAQRDFLCSGRAATTAAQTVI